MELTLRVGKNVTREFDKMKNGSHLTLKNGQAKRRSASLDRIQPRGKFCATQNLRIFLEFFGKRHLFHCMFQ